MELSRDLPSDAQLVGYDISSAQFPNEESLPPQVRLELLDILSDELPKELLGTFDVVHVRALVLVVQAGDPRTILSNSCALLSMSRKRDFSSITRSHRELGFSLQNGLEYLCVFTVRYSLIFWFLYRLTDPTEPGGYLQWDEADMSAFQSLVLSSEATNAASSRLVQHELQYLRACGFQNEYVLPSATKKQRSLAFYFSLCLFFASFLLPALRSLVTNAQVGSNTFPTTFHPAPNWNSSQAPASPSATSRKN